MPFDNFVTGAIAAELDGALAEGRVERVHQPERHEVILHVNVPPRGRDEGDGRKHHDLLISSHGSRPYVYLSDRRAGNPQTPPAFCMLLRKHLVGARVERVFRVARERIIRIDFDAPDELGLRRRRALLFEIMGKHSNIILLDENDVVIDAIKRIYTEAKEGRPMLPGSAYTLPTPGKGIGPLMEAETKEGKPLSYYEALDAEGSYEPLIFTDGTGRMQDYYVFDIALYEGLGRVRCPSVSAMLESYYEEKESTGRLGQKCADLRQILKGRTDKLYLKKQRLLEDIEKAKRADEYRLKGELITANIYRLTKGMEEAELETFAAAPETDEGTSGRETAAAPEAPLPGGVLRVALDPLLTPAQNAQRYFKKYAKARTALTEKAKQIEITERDIAFLESYRVFMDNATDTADVDRLREELSELGYVRRRSSGKKARSGVKKEYLRYESSAGLPLYVGRSGKENDELTLRKAKPDDLWLHTKDIPGSHVILVRSAQAARAGGPAALEGAPPGFDEVSLREAAQVAAYYSKARRSESVPVDYCLVKYVKKPSGAKPGAVIFTHNKTLYVKPALPPGPGAP
jgi:predicted ribosome quality control (RQC) complex YloA/Tae2 family protein